MSNAPYCKLIDGPMHSAGAVQPEGQSGWRQGSGHCGASSGRRNSSYPFANLVPQDGSGKAFERTPDEVLPPVHMLQCMPAHVYMTLTQQAHLLPPMGMRQ